MKYRCDTCEEVFDEDDAGTYKEHHYLDGQKFTEHWMACPRCGELDLEEVGECSVCGEWTRDKLCKECRQEVWEHFVKTVNIAKTKDGKEAILDCIQDFVEDYET